MLLRYLRISLLVLVLKKAEPCPSGRRKPFRVGPQFSQTRHYGRLRRPPGEALRARAARFATAAPAHVRGSLRSLFCINVARFARSIGYNAPKVTTSEVKILPGLFILFMASEEMRGRSLRGRGLRGHVPTSRYS